MDNRSDGSRVVNAATRIDERPLFAESGVRSGGPRSGDGVAAHGSDSAARETAVGRSVTLKGHEAAAFRAFVSAGGVSAEVVRRGHDADAVTLAVSGKIDLYAFA